MAEAKLIIKDSNSNLLFDTRYVTYGLVSSGYLTLKVYWARRSYKGGNTNPAFGYNWTDTYAMAEPTTYNDVLHGFKLNNAKSPIAFITGGGSLNTITRNSDGSSTFWYTGASESTKFYCFDLMGDNITGGPFLKTRNESNVITFNSLQPPLNIYTTVTAPIGQPNASRTINPYIGGYGTVVDQMNQRQGTYRYQVDLPLSAGEYAAHCTFSRGCTVETSIDFRGYTHGMVEGAYGRTNGFSFVFNVAGGTPYNLNNPPPIQTTFDNLPIGRRPTAIIIDTRPYPFPYN